MYVYFIRRRLDGAIKVGFTGRPPAMRVREIQNATGVECDLMFALPGDRKDERAIHDSLAEYRMSGEWFRGEEHVLGMIEYFRQESTPEGREQHRRQRAGEAAAKVLQERLGIPFFEAVELARAALWAAARTQ